jgi:hypothetical protein
MEEHKKLSNACLALDGTMLSPAILSLAEQLMQAGALTNLVICHIYNHRKTYLPSTMRQNGIRDLVNKKFPLAENVVHDFKALEADKGVHELLLTTHHLRKCDLLFIGYHTV